jgi:soluble lytic murein transglycosylase
MTALALLLVSAGARAAEAPATSASVAVVDEAEKPVPFDPRWIQPFFAKGLAEVAAERFRIEDWKGAAEGFAKAVRALPPASPDRLPALYLLGLARMNLGEWAAAGTVFEDLHGKYPLLAAYHAYYAARCRLRRGDSAGAIEWAARVPAGSVLEAETVLIKLDAFAATQRWADLEVEAARFLERFPAGPRRAEAMFQRGQALERLGRPAEEATAVYRRIWAEAPLETWSRRAEERLLALSPADAGASWRGATADEWMSRAMILFDRNQNVEAEAAFGAALAAAGAPGKAPADLACRAQFHLAQSLFKQKQRTNAVPVFVQAQASCRQAGNKDLLVKALYQGARCQASAGDRAAALAAYASIEADAREHSYADDARLRTAELYTDAQDEAQAAACLAEIPARYPAGDQLGEALWRLALAAIRAGRLDEAHRWLDENLRRIPHEDVWYAEGRALYWKARVLGKQGKPRDALAFYTRAVREYPLSVYALLSLERMRLDFPDARRSLVTQLRAGLEAPEPKGGPWQFGPRPVFGAPEFRRGVELARMGLGSDARRELARIGFVAPDNRDAARRSGPPSPEREDVFWITAILLDRGRSWNASHAIPRYSVTGYRLEYPAGRRAAAWRLSYPRAFPELVTAAIHATIVPEPLELAIMREEGTFNPRAESIANALGLTQMVVRTAQRFWERPVTRDTLLDPAKNLQIGARFLQFQLERYGGLAPLAIAGYNAGEAAVDRWLRERGDVEMDEFLETIPFDETRNYTKRVLASYMAYSWLYAPKRPVPELSFSLKPPRPEHVGRPAGRADTRRPRPRR